MNNNYSEIYISVDIEATGPIPGVENYSMSSIGGFVAGGRTHDGNFVHFDRHDKTNMFYGELQPISDNYIPEAINVGLLEGFDTSTPDPDGSRHFEWMKTHGEHPKNVMSAFINWVNARAEHHGGSPVFMAYPASFDWTFVYWYMINFGLTSPFGFSKVLDLKTFYAARAEQPMKKSSKRSMPKHLFPKLPHTHRADDDALEQGVFGINMLQWDGNR